MMPTPSYDVVVVGGGIVGLATAWVPGGDSRPGRAVLEPGRRQQCEG